jgi:alanine dehydrogenase
MTDALWIEEADVVSLMHLGEAINALQDGLLLEQSGQAQNMVKTHASWGGGHTLHALGATVEGAGIIGTKTWAHTASGATPLLVMWDSESGALKAIIEAFAMGQMRTGAMSGVATRIMAPEDASVMTMIGTGKQALTQVAAVCAVRPIKRVNIFSPTPENREKFADTVREAGLGIDVEASDTLNQALDGASVITLATRARTPFLSAQHLPKNVHINAVGAITPEREEFTQDVFELCGAVAVDNKAAARKLSKEFVTRFGDDDAAWQQVAAVNELVGAPVERGAEPSVSLFKAMGMGISDLALGIEILKRAEATGRGRPVPQPKRAKLRLTA